MRLSNHTRYVVTAYDGEVEIDIRCDDGGWSGCGHPGEINLTRKDLAAMLELLDASVPRGEETDA